ncbi:unannotated protein [freshwater metagenome]|uniref:Unannotated protein n=1 Tax=freshwater metagenome TaxID=449393 RepID=A0A6J6VBH2_9ZZZZ
MRMLTRFASVQASAGLVEQVFERRYLVRLALDFDLGSSLD